MFVAALFGGLVFEFWYRVSQPYIDPDAAIARGLTEARVHCREQAGTRPVRCGDVRLVSIDEAIDGWWMEFVSSKYPGTDGSFVSRRNDYVETGSDWGAKSGATKVGT